MGWRWPLRFGARDRTQDIEHQALLDYLRKGFDVESGTALYAETRVDALATTMIWRVNARVANQNNPRRMLDNLTSWETACTLRPSVGDSDTTRRDRLAGKLRGLSGNSKSDIAGASEGLLGIHFAAFVEVDPSDEITYWPGLSPGPPGYEWSSNRATVGVQMSTQQLSDGELRDKRNRLIQMLISLVPTWQTFVVGTDDTFLCGVGVVGQSVIA